MSAIPSMLALVGDAFGGRGGIAQYNRDFFNALIRAEAVSGITVLPRLSPDIPTVPEMVRQLPARPGRACYSVTALLRAVMQPVDIVFCGHIYMVCLAALIARLKGAKLVLQTHGIEVWPRPSRRRRAAVESADLVLCVSRHTRKALLTWSAIEPDRVVVLPNTVRSVFTPGDTSRLRSGLGLDSKRVLLTVARMDASQRYKGQDRVIAVLPDLVAKGFDVEYLIAGEGSDRPRLEALARDAGVSERVRFLGAIDLESLIETYRMADLFVLPSTGEGFGIAFLEAMASGTPSLGLGSGGARDALAEGELGTITSEAGLADSISRLLSSGKPDAQSLAAAVWARFGVEPFVANVAGALNRLKEAA